MKKLILLILFVVILLGGCFIETADYDRETIAKTELAAKSLSAE